LSLPVREAWIETFIYMNTLGDFSSLTMQERGLKNY